jgi:hypothetical protein
LPSQVLPRSPYFIVLTVFLEFTRPAGNFLAFQRIRTFLFKGCAAKAFRPASSFILLACPHGWRQILIHTPLFPLLVVPVDVAPLNFAHEIVICGLWFCLAEATQNFSSLLYKSNPWTSFNDFLVLICSNDPPEPAGTAKVSSDAPRDDINDRLAVEGLTKASHER